MKGFKSNNSIILYLRLLFLQLSLVACVGTDGTALNGLAGVTAVTPTPGPYSTPLPEAARLKIFAVAGTTAIGNTSLTVGDNYQLRAVLVDTTGAIISEVDATWATTGNLGSGNLTKTAGDPGPRAEFHAAGVSSGTIQATIDDAELAHYSSLYTIVQSTTSTGTINVSLALVPDQIIIVSGNTQSGQVGTNLGQNLTVRVTNAASTPVPGVNVTFAVLSGGGQIISAQPIATDVNGESECIVKLGGQIGASGQTFTASISSGTSPQVVFYATGTPGPAAKLSFTQQPAIANVGANFSTQPIVEVQDSYGNKVTGATNSVALTVATGTGALTGGTTLAAVAGTTTFANVGYNTAENGVSITASSAGLTSATSSLFNVGSVTASATCLVNDAAWTTTEGGCKNIAMGLVWSARSASTMTWYQAVWKFGDAGSSAAEAWETALGITTDIVGAGSDLSGTAYCHDLVESGLSDWRAPTYAEAVTTQSIYTPGTYLRDANATIWTGTFSSGQGYGGNLQTGGGTMGGYTLPGANYGRCVRRSAPTKLIITQQVSAPTKGLGVNVGFETQLVVKVADATNSIDITSNASITLSHNGTGQLCLHNPTTGVRSSCGATITMNATAGILTTTNLSYSKAETIQITASSSGLTSVTSAAIVVNQTYPYANCKIVGGSFINAAGGCKDLTTGYIFSSETVSSTSWHDAVWDQTAPGNGSSQDIYDNGETNDYGGFAAGSTPDNSTYDYCHDLTESGKFDWILAPYAAWFLVMSKTPTSYLPQLSVASPYYFTQRTVAGTETHAYFYNGLTNAMSNNAKSTSSYRAVCTRQDPPSQLVFVQQPGGGAYGFGAGVDFATPPIVHVRDADGATLYNQSYVVRLTVIGGTGQLCVNNTSCASYQEVNVVSGAATFNNLSYTKPSETITLRASMSSTITIAGVTHTVSTADSNAIVIPAIWGGSACTATPNWSSQFGGCRDTLASGLVWSHTFNPGAFWYETMWDSLYPSEEAVDGSDGVLVDHYDAAYPPGTGVVNTVNNVGCHSLKLNGYTDWRMPTRTELQNLNAVGRQGYAAVKNLTGYTYVWSSSTDQADNSKAYMYNITTGQPYNAGTYTGYTKAYTGAATICVRPSSP